MSEAFTTSGILLAAILLFILHSEGIGGMRYLTPVWYVPVDQGSGSSSRLIPRKGRVAGVKTWMQTGYSG